MVRRALVLLTVLPLAAAAAWHASANVAPSAPASFFVSGRGWGHGIGMSQWGAYGFAQRGAAYDEILAHYYRGTILGQAPVARVRVLLAEGRKTATIASDAPFRVRDGSGETFDLAAGAHAFGPGLKLKVGGAAEARALTAPLVFLPGARPLRFSNPYRGQIRVNVVKSRLQVINNVGLEAYLYGVVPREVPFGWPGEALKAQAVVARSYALAVRKTGAFDLFSDVRSQVYGGMPAEKASTNAAVDATAGQVLLFDGKVATTFFFSTSGGRTASIQHVWRNGVPTPYLVSVPDPHDSASPHHAWGPVRFTAARLGTTFKVPGRVVDVRVSLNGSQRADVVTFVGAKGEVKVPAADVRTKLGLRSTWFRFGVLSLVAPKAPAEYGSGVRLTGVLRGSATATLEQRVSGKVWEPAARVKAGKNGAVSVAVKPLVSTHYRLTASTALFGTPVRVRVAPRVRLQAPLDPTLLRGLVRPIVPGAKVDLQRRTGAAWRSVATATLAENGTFEASLTLVPGEYRARVALGNGLVPGFSPVLRVIAG